MSYRRPVQVLVHAVRRTGDGWRYLMLHRVPQRGGFWPGVTRGADWGEELEDAARRELLEETSLPPNELRQVDCSYTTAMQERWRESYGPGAKQIKACVFLAVVEGDDVVLSPDEHDACRWCGCEQALALLACPENTKARQCCRQPLEESKRHV
jgi:8-oxo-dGTP pyrophosphatase MutT (NUDIX family)